MDIGEPDYEIPDWFAAHDEPLHPDLDPWVEEEGGPLGRMLRHPLVYAVPLVHHGMVNHAYEVKRAALEKAVRDRDLHTYVFLHERPYRFEALLAGRERIQPDSDQWWAVVGDVWIDSENLWQHADEWRELLALPDARAIMTDDEREALAALPDVVTVWRGCQATLNEDGLSYTLDRRRAEWFAVRFSGRGDHEVLVEATVPRDRIVAYLTRRGEDEIVAHDADVTVVSYHEIG